MPEGPSIVILKELVEPFKGKKVISVSGNTKVQKERAANQKVTDFKSWGKHFLICFEKFTMRIHFMLFGSYRINEEKETPTRLSLNFRNGVLNFYTCSVAIIDEPLEKVYDWSEDVMADEWDAKAALNKLKSKPDMLVCDALLDQHIFSGSGNIIKNEVLFRLKIHPESTVGSIPSGLLNQLVDEVRVYSFDFLRWKQKFELKKHWQAHTKKECPRCNKPIIKQYLGKTNRRTFFCKNCQVLYK